MMPRPYPTNSVEEAFCELRLEGVLGSPLAHRKDERGIVGVYPFVLPGVYPSSTPHVQVDVHAAVVFFIVLECLTGDALSDGALVDAQPMSGLLYRHPVQPGVYPLRPCLDTIAVCNDSGPPLVSALEASVPGVP
jgi:hypothetical protein